MESTNPFSVLDSKLNRIETTLEDIKTGNHHLDKPVRYISRQRVANMLDIALSTVDNWQNAGILKGYKIGGVVRYKEVEVIKVFENHNKYSRSR